MDGPKRRFFGGRNGNLVVPDMDLDDKSKRRTFARDAMARSVAVMSRQRKRILAFISGTLTLLGLGVVGLCVTGAVLIADSEICKYPGLELSETFRFRTNNDLVSIQEMLAPGAIKPFLLTGPILDTLEIEVGFGSVTLQTTDDLLDTDILIQVFSRAKSRSALPTMVFLNASIIATPQNDTLNTVQYTSYVKVTSEGSNVQTGPHPCRRSDIVITLPSRCLLDATNFVIKVDKGPIYVDSTAIDANVKGLTLQSGAGDITVLGAQSTRINVNVTRGDIMAENLIGNVIFLLAIQDGSLIHARNVTLFPGNGTDCKVVTTYPVGFEGSLDRAEQTTVCPVREGKLTFDAQGADIGSDPAVNVELVRGGSIEGSVKVGNIRVELYSCIQYAGSYAMQASHGTKKVRVDQSAKLFSDLRELYANDPELVSPDVVNLLVTLAAREYSAIYLPSQTNVRNAVAGTICSAKNGTQTVSLKTLTTGNIEIVLLPPLDGLV